MAAHGLNRKRQWRRFSGGRGDREGNRGREPIDLGALPTRTHPSPSHHHTFQWLQQPFAHTHTLSHPLHIQASSYLHCFVELATELLLAGGPGRAWFQAAGNGGRRRDGAGNGKPTGANDGKRASMEREQGARRHSPCSRGVFQSRTMRGCHSPNCTTGLRMHGPPTLIVYGQ